MTMLRRSSPQLSVGLPVYNGESYLRTALDSLVEQSFQDFEIIVSDNCSTDSTASIVSEYQKRDWRITYVRQRENLGAIGNFNFVFRQARAKYFKWAAYDDVCDRTYLQRCIDVLDNNSDVVWCHCESDQIDELGNSWLDQLDPSVSDSVEVLDGVKRWAGFPRPDCDSLDASKRFAGLLLGTTWAPDSYGLIRTSALRKSRLLLPHYGAEKVLLGELALSGRYYHIPEQLFAQRIHDEASGNIRSSRFQTAFALGSSNGKRAFVPTRFSLLLAHLGSVCRAEISTRERLACYSAVCRYVLQVQKWKKVFRSSILGSGFTSDGASERKKVMAAARGRE